MKDLIEKLKDKNYVRAFGLMKPEERQVLATAKFGNRLVFISDWGDDFDGVGGRSEFTFALKPDYQPELTWDKCQYCGSCRLVRPSGKWQFNCECDNPEKRPKKPEPEFVDLEIVQGGDWLGVHRADAEGRVVLPHGFFHLHCLPSMEKFDDFWYEDSPGCKFFGIKETAIARCRFEGKKVFARFRI